MKLVHWLVAVPVALILIVFAISNREAVTVTFWPLPVVFGAPLWLVVLLASGPPVILDVQQHAGRLAAVGDENRRRSHPG